MEHGILHDRSQGLIDAAYRFAKHAHGSQKRKYTGEPYITHPVAVAHIVASVTDDCEMICAALLHDVIEDTAATAADLLQAGFGFGIVDLAVWLTDVSKPEDGNREVRKAIDRLHSSAAPSRAQTVKYADLIHNCESIIAEDPNFAKVFMKEKRLLLESMDKGNSILRARAFKLLEDWEARELA